MRILLSLTFALGMLTAYSQATIEFRISTVSNNLDDMDGFLQGDSDPVWEFEILDGTTNLGSSSYAITANCPGTRTVNNTFASRNYNCALPANFTFRWRAYEDDGWFFGELTEANTGWQSLTVPAGALTATSFTNIATYTATASGDNCSGGGTVTWGITLQYRITGSFLTNTAPTSITASSIFVQTGQNVMLTQVGGSILNGAANYTWTTGSCNGPIVGTGPVLITAVPGTTTYYVKSAGTCTTACTSITISASALGVTLSDYYYLCSDGQIGFYWRTESEANNDYFEIQRMEAPEVWTTISTIKGHGNSSVTHQYEFEIPSTTENNDHYYRLTQVDKDGMRTEYDPFYVSCKTNVKEISVFPNPNNGTWSLSPYEKDLQLVAIRNQQGRLVPFEQQDTEIQLLDPVSGTYYIEYISGGQQVVKKVIVER